ncbi:DUF502 domain-containing protein [Helicobacter sp. 11S02629-2]|uniref:DUF502 domain-containing protein n=1 Tax=Helicobacter sp. 11S02629-2 TaxID=1476195 RepID=UPI000BA79BFE|nr:DUF502 domain-containing protein [Helicobacter sp. 11S02629-2]PAF44350.1 hypothetical protein BKH40_05495 [Helicobacter sp. 11S02629-2]
MGIIRLFGKGILALLPFIILIWIINFVFGIVKGLWQIVFNTTSNNIIATTIILIVSVLVIIFIGYQFEKKQKNLFMGIFEFTVSKIPMIGSIYHVLKDMVGMFTGNAKEAYLGVAYVDLVGTRLMGFITKQEGDYYWVFVPTTPNPTSGFLLSVHKDQLVHADITVSDGLKKLLSLGMK